jgi:hypothetical protein
MARETRTVTRNRDAGDGRFLTDRQAARKPANEVVRERVPKPGYGDTKPKR